MSGKLALVETFLEITHIISQMVRDHRPGEILKLQKEFVEYVLSALLSLMKLTFIYFDVKCEKGAECDISVSKLLGFETFPIVLMVSVSDSENFGIKKSICISFEKNWY